MCWRSTLGSESERLRGDALYCYSHLSLYRTGSTDHSPGESLNRFTVYFSLWI